MNICEALWILELRSQKRGTIVIKELEKIAAFCKKNEIEINIDEGEIGLWFLVNNSSFMLMPIKPENVEKAVAVITEFRKWGFKTN